MGVRADGYTSVRLRGEGMAYKAEEVATLLDSSFQGADSSDDDLGFHIHDIELLENPQYVEGTADGKYLYLHSLQEDILYIII